VLPNPQLIPRKIIFLIEILFQGSVRIDLRPEVVRFPPNLPWPTFWPHGEKAGDRDRAFAA